MNLPAWNIESEYPSITSAEFLEDEKLLKSYLLELKASSEKLKPLLQSAVLNPKTVEQLQSMLRLMTKVKVTWYNLSAYVSATLSIDATLEESKTKSSQLESVISDFAQTFKPVQLFLITCDQAWIDSIFQAADLKPALFEWEQSRLWKNKMLSEKEEILLTALSTSGFEAWSNLYSTLSGTVRVRLEMNGKTEEIGIAQASGMTRSSNALERKTAWQGIQQAWKTHEEAAASILNGLAGWRLEIYKKKSHTEAVNYLTSPLHENRIQKETLDAMMTAIENNRLDLQKSLPVMAKLLKKSKLDPWDLMAPAPIAKTEAKIEFSQALQMITKAFSGAHPSFGQFVEMMAEKKWIEARVLPNKGNGAYCMGFPKSRTPRVFQTFLGSNYDISTLAHELGHAYHSWVLKDLPIDETEYPSTLAETASIFAETVLADELIANCKTKEEKLEFVWGEAEGAIALLLNIPARFEFEKNFYELRKEKVVSPKELSLLMDQAWTKWYGNHLSENDKMFWASKLHFSMSGASFYNFPYAFGYLFALSVYARRKELGADFWPKYQAILMDTGRMTAEDLVQKHLGEDIRQPQFWQKSLNVVKSKLANLQELTTT